MNNTDNLFKKKLEDVNITPPQKAWTRVEVQLSKKNNGLPWFRMAAAFLLLGLLTATLVYLQTDEVPGQVTSVKKEVNSDSARLPQVKEKAMQQLADQKVEMKKALPKVQPQVEKVTPLPIEKTPDQPMVALQETESKHDTINNVVAALPAARPIVIEYVLSPLPKAKQVPEAPLLAAKKTGLQKALEFAQEAKNSDNPLGGLRQAKNELFALGFKKDKQKKQ